MKELEHSEAPGTRALKSLLKKPGQVKQRTHKNRVVINEKLNEFFAADYIILIKEECCADYEEECDCCCQETEMIRVGNCKECRAELTRHLACGIDPRYNNIDRNCEIDCNDDNNRSRIVSSEESQCEDEEDEDEYEEEVDEYEEEGESSEEHEQQQQQQQQQQRESDNKKLANSQNQQETLSPPEGYKDVCDDEKNNASGNEQLCVGNVCGECNYYHRASDVEEQKSQGILPEGDAKVTQENPEDALQPTSDQAQQTTPDLHQRYLVETITMTTVTERRIVREISEEEPRPTIEHQETQLLDSTEQKPIENNDHVHFDTKEDEDTKNQPKSQESNKDQPDPSELSLTFKLGNVSLVANSHKPNSAVRQLFPDPRFISPPPAPTKMVSLSNDEATDSDSSEAQRFLITTESLRLFDSVKRSKISGSRSDSSESDSSSVKRTIERNALRRSLICKYDSVKKKNLKSKDLTLEERIRQLTCVDQDEDNNDSASESQTTESADTGDFPVRTSPSGEERPRNERVVRPTNNCQDHSSPNLHHHHHHHQQSAYRKITDIFGQKKIDNMPDLGIGDRANLMKDYNKQNLTKMTSDARKQFLSSLTPLSCVASTGVDNRDDYYQISKLSNRDTIGYNSDSSYSLEDIEAALRGEERNSKNLPGPPDVTRGTPTGVGPDQDATTDELLAFVEQDKTRTERLKKRYDTDEHQETLKNGDNSTTQHDDDDDELNDYGFNTRPSVRGIKPQFESTSEIVRQLRSRAIPTVITDKTRQLLAPWPYYDTSTNPDKPNLPDEQVEIVEGRDNTIKRINTMQRQIDDIYQTIAETAVTVQGNIERGSYLESTLPRTLPRDCRYEQANGHYHDNRAGIYSTLPNKTRRIGINNYQCGILPIENSKCYRTMYFVPYNGITDPTYQNIQRILPPHSSANYADHIERYPYPRNRPDQQPGQPRYYVRPPAPPVTSGGAPPLHLHLHQPEDFRFAAPPNSIGMQSVQLQHHQHISQLATYNVQTLPAYTVMAPSRAGGYAYSLHPGNRTAADVQTQTVSMAPMISTSVSGFNGIGNASSSSSTSSVLSSPTKIQGQRNNCTAERGVPEGAASAPSHDFGTQVNSGGTVNSNFIVHNNVPPPNTQNSVYYAMNV